MNEKGEGWNQHVNAFVFRQRLTHRGKLLLQCKHQETHANKGLIFTGLWQYLQDYMDTQDCVYSLEGAPFICQWFPCNASGVSVLKWRGLKGPVLLMPKVLTFTLRLILQRATSSWWLCPSVCSSSAFQKWHHSGWVALNTSCTENYKTNWRARAKLAKT